MNAYHKFLLNQRLIPSIVMFVIFPRCFYYKSWDALIITFSVIFVIFSISYSYLIIRNIIANNYTVKSKLIFDTLLVIVGIIIACILNVIHLDFYYITFLTAIPMFLDNYFIINRKEK